MSAATILPVRLQLSRRAGFNLQMVSHAVNGRAAVNCARPGPWGNPYTIAEWGREQAIALHRTALTCGRELLADNPEALAWRDRTLARIGELTGKNLACWCPLPPPYERDRCHTAVYFELANPGWKRAA